MNDPLTMRSLLKNCWEIDKQINKYYLDVLKQWGLTSNSFLALDSLLNRPEGMEPAQLADEIGVQRQLVTAILNDFEKHGFILRKENKEDHRRKRILLSKKGSRFANEVLDKIFEIDRHAFSLFSHEEMEQILDYHRRFYHHLTGKLFPQ